MLRKLLVCAICAMQFLGALEYDLSSQTVVSFDHSGGRMGDNLLAYLHAKWISYKMGIPLVCNYWGFNHADKFILYDKERNLGNTKHPSHRVNLDCLHPVPTRIETPTTFAVPYFPESSWEWVENGGAWCRLFEVDWKDPVFRQLCLEMIAPKHEVSLVLPPPGVISVAIHARQGGNFEYASPQFDAPLKRPPMTFYRDALQKVIELFPEMPLHCHLFTDAVHPEEIAKVIFDNVPNNVGISWRQEANSDAINVVDDFFSLFHYDILIRPESNFSMVPSLLKDYAVLVTPKHAVNVPEIFIDEIDVTVQTGKGVGGRG